MTIFGMPPGDPEAVDGVKDAVDVESRVGLPHDALSPDADSPSDEDDGAQAASPHLRMR